MSHVLPTPMGLPLLGTSPAHPQGPLFLVQGSSASTCLESAGHGERSRIGRHRATSQQRPP